MEYKENILIIDFGSQYTQLIARRIREAGVFSQIVPHSISLAKLNELNPTGIVLSGGPMSVYDEYATKLSFAFKELKVSVLGICYGLQLICNEMGGKVVNAYDREYGKAELQIIQKSKLFEDIEDNSVVWMSHGDIVESIPEGFTAIASSENTHFCAVENLEINFYGVQFHPEVAHTVFGQQILNNFLFKICKCVGNWSPKSFIGEFISKFKQTDDNSNIICALSGGVDSTVAAVLMDKVVGTKLFCIHIDNGLMRQNESDIVVKKFREQFNLNVIHINAEEVFLTRLAGISDPETKRKIIGKTFIDLFEIEAKKIKNVKYLVQGTLYPDVIESVSVKGNSVTIKSHHNVGGLPDKMNLKLIEPLRELFKDEVRRVGAELGIEKEFLDRHPFPGPGLAVRVLGDITKERLDILREADEIYISEIISCGFYDKIWQAFAVLLPVNSVGVMGDQRTYANVLALRAVTSLDGMTADWFHFPYDFLASVSSKIINKIKGVNRVVYDISSKPPATIEWE